MPGELIKNKVISFEELKNLLIGNKITLPKLEIKLIGKVINPGDEGWHGLTKEEQEKNK